MAKDIYEVVDDRVPFTYLIGWSKLDKWYYGVRWKKGCKPEHLWTKYFTSSRYVREYRSKHGEPDIIEIRKVFKTSIQAIRWEQKVIIRSGAIHSERWLNMGIGTGDFFITEHSELAKVKMKIRAQGRKPWNADGRTHSPETRKTISKMAKGRLWITNPLTGNNRRIRSDEKIPEGWFTGRTDKTQIGSFWIKNIGLSLTTKVPKDSVIPEGWCRGRLNAFVKK